MRFNEKDVIFNYPVFVTISEQAYDYPLLDNITLSQGFILLKTF